MRRMALCCFVMTLSGCATSDWHSVSGMQRKIIQTDKYDILTYQKITDNTSPINIYIEGDGNSFTKRGIPTDNPTPNSTLVRDMADSDNAANVAYIARPCQYIMSDACTQSDWTDGRFSPDIINAMRDTVKQVAGDRPISLIGYSGGALVSGYIIKNNPDMKLTQWITVSGVLNHADWTQYFGDKPLKKSVNLESLPDIQQVHFVAEKDKVVPRKLSQKWTHGKPMIVIKNATHNKYPKQN